MAFHTDFPAPHGAKRRKVVFMNAIHRFLAAAVLGASAFGAMAQGTPPPPPGPPSAGAMAREHGRFDPARFEQHLARRQAEFKQRLQITPAQEGAWNTWVAAVRPPANWMETKHARHAEMQRLTTPERIDRMRAWRAERAAQQDRRGEATKVFYAALTPYQRGIFDARMQHHDGGRHRGQGRRD